MIPQIIASIILLGSFAGIVYFVIKKFPLLLAFPAVEEGESVREVMERIRVRIKDSDTLKPLASPDLFAQKMLSKARILALKTENKTGDILEDMRKKSQDKRPKFSEDYWKQLKKRK